MPKAKKQVEETIPHIVTEEDLVNNPDLVTEGIKVGDEIQIPKPSATDTQEIDHTDIYDDADQFVRQYSREVHGDNFAELAESYLIGHPTCHKA